MDNFRKLYGYGYGKGLLSHRLMGTKQNKGHFKQFKLLTERWRNGGDPLIPFEELVNTTRTTFAALESLKKGKWVEVDKAPPPAPPKGRE